MKDSSTIFILIINRAIILLFVKMVERRLPGPGSIPEPDVVSPMLLWMKASVKCQSTLQ